jgi:prolyl-tRNA editing enzyme YbaK/EbsC (Cys-tRNA(Pro) deacylase)
VTVTLALEPALDRPDLLASPVAAAIGRLAPAGPIEVAPIDPDLADTAAFCAHYGVAPDASANCVIVAARRGETTRLAACVVLATTRADVNGLVRKHLGARKVSFAPREVAVADSGMEFGGITPIGLPADWPVLIDRAVLGPERVIVGSGIRGSKLWLPPAALAAVPGAEVLDGLGIPVAPPMG